MSHSSFEALRETEAIIRVFVREREPIFRVLAVQNVMNYFDHESLELYVKASASETAFPSSICRT